MHSLDKVLDQPGEDFLLEAIRHSGPDRFEAVIQTGRGVYLIGTFKTELEASQAIKDALEAHWCG